MKLINFKNITIFFLLVLTFIQTNKLWFGNSPNHNFFNFYSSGNMDYNSIENIESLKNPYRIIANLGKENGNFIIKYNELEDLEIKKATDLAIKQFLKNGYFVETYDVDWENLLKNKSIIYEYKFLMPSNSFAKSFGVKTNIISQKTPFFDFIIIVPDIIKTSSVMKIYVVDSQESNKYYEYKLDKSTIKSDDILNSIQDTLDNHEGILYTSTAQKGYSVFKNNTFVANIQNNEFEYNYINESNAYSDSGDTPTLNMVAKKIEPFFGNPDFNYIPDVNDTYKYTDNNIVVNYDPIGVLEYFDYTTTNKKISPTFDSSYSAAMHFIKKDVTIQNEFYLDNYDHIDNTWIFNFNLTINDFPIKLSETLKTSKNLEMDCAFQVTVTDNIVTRYKHFVPKYEVDVQNSAIAKTDYISAINRMDLDMSESENDNMMIKNLELAYNIDNSYAYKLSWFISIPDAPTSTISAN